MALTLRAVQDSAGTTVLRRLTPQEVDNNFLHVLDSANGTFIQSGTGAIAGTVQGALRLFVHTSQYDTAANYNTARAALTGTIGVPSLDVATTLTVLGSGPHAIGGAAVAAEALRIYKSASATEGFVVFANGNVSVGRFVSNDYFSVDFDRDGFVNSVVNNDNTGTSAGSRFDASSPASSITVEKLGSSYVGTGARQANFGVVLDSGAGLNLAAFDAAGLIKFYTGGIAAGNERWQITASGHLLAVDNTYDIGASGATRPRTGYFGTSLIAPTLQASTQLNIGSTDCILVRDAANTLAQRNGTAAQTFNLYNTFTDASNYERGELLWSTNIFFVGTRKAGTGTARTLSFFTDGTQRWDIGATTGHLIAATDNAQDIGASGATRPRTGYFGTSLLAPFLRTDNAATGAAVNDTVQFYGSDDAAGHTIPSFYCEGTNVLATGQADSASTVRVKMRINGTVVTLLAI